MRRSVGLSTESSHDGQSSEQRFASLLREVSAFGLALFQRGDSFFEGFDVVHVFSIGSSPAKKAAKKKG
jgi:hypothetical protein